MGQKSVTVFHGRKMELLFFGTETLKKPLWKIWNTLRATAIIPLERTAVCNNHGAIKSLPQ